MSELRVDRIKSSKGPISIAGITSFSGTGYVTLPVGTIPTRSKTPQKGEVRYVNGDILKTLEYYNGTTWVTLGVV